MEFRPDVSCIRGQNVTLPGGQDKDGHPIILITIPQDSSSFDIVPALNYIISIFRYAFYSLLQRLKINFRPTFYKTCYMREKLLSFTL